MKQTTLRCSAQGSERDKGTLAVVNPVKTTPADPHTFSALWETLSKNYARNRRDFHLAYGGRLFYHKVDSLYRFGKDDLPCAETTRDLTTPSTLPVPAISGQEMQTKDNIAYPVNKKPVKLLVFTNDLLTNNEKFTLLKAAYQQGLFYAILTLRRGHQSDLSPLAPTLTGDWQSLSLFQSILADTTPSRAACLPGNRIEDSDSDSEDETGFCADDKDEEEDNNEEETEDNPDRDNPQSDTTPYDNFKKIPKRFGGFASAMSPKAYRLETYQQFFSPFFHATKRVPHDIHLLPDFC